ncbi:MAG: Na+:solute symporter [Pirellulales bacterium]|nr:Na+:solute symporter [Pirellulales bacterium]
MSILDYAILVGFLLWMLVIGGICTTRMKNSGEMFVAGRQSPWWVSGLSGFMTIFSAGTFVVWGGIAYRLGLVAVTILMIMGLSTFCIGLSIAPRWQRLGITTPVEFLRIRFNQSVVQAYTWLGMIYRGIGMGVGLYALAVMVSVLMPLPEGFPLRDPRTGNLSVGGGILLWSAVVVAYTMAGGLWAVLLTDVIQCIILCLVVLVTVPLSLGEIGGLGQLWRQAPQDFFQPAAAEYSWGFLVLWFLVGYFRYSADWPFVQRYICVPSPRDAAKVAFLMGGLYLVSPLIWMLPAMAYRVIDPHADPEKAYILICQRVLPSGMLGIMVAAMFSATASMISGMLNVFAGVFTRDVYYQCWNPQASERQMVLVGRLATLAYGAFITFVAFLVPEVGGAEDVVIALVTVLLGPLMLPVVWGFYSRHISSRAVWRTLIVSSAAAAGVYLLLALLPPVVSNGETVNQSGALGTFPRFSTPVAPQILEPFFLWMKSSGPLVNSILGFVVPLAVLLFEEVRSRRFGADAGWLRLESFFAVHREKTAGIKASRMPAVLVAASLLMLGIVMAVITACASKQRLTLAIFSLMLLLGAAAVFGRLAFLRPGTSLPSNPDLPS